MAKVRNIGVYAFRYQYGSSQTYKAIVQEFKTVRQNIKTAKKLGSITQQQFKENLNKIRYEQAKLYRQLNPAKGQLRTLKQKEILKTTYVKTGKTFGVVELEKRVPVPQKEIYKIEKKFKENTKTILRQVNRFNKYGRTLNLNNLEISVGNDKKTVYQWLEQQKAATRLNRAEKAKITRAVNKAAKQISKIKVSKYKGGEFSLRGDLTKVKKNQIWLDWSLPEKVEEISSDYPTEHNGWIIYWRLANSSKNLINAKIATYGEGEFDIEAHVQLIKHSSPHIESESNFYTIIAKLKGDALGWNNSKRN